MKTAVIKEKNIMQYVKAGLFSLCTTFALILLFAVLIKFTSIPDVAIKPVNMVIKVLSIGVGVFFVTQDGKKGLVKGAIFGVVYVVLAFVIFSVLSKTFKLDWGVMSDIAFGGIAGVLLGILFVNFRK